MLNRYLIFKMARLGWEYVWLVLDLVLVFIGHLNSVSKFICLPLAGSKIYNSKMDIYSCKTYIALSNRLNNKYLKDKQLIINLWGSTVTLYW